MKIAKLFTRRTLLFALGGMLAAVLANHSNAQQDLVYEPAGTTIQRDTRIPTCPADPLDDGQVWINSDNAPDLVYQTCHLGVWYDLADRTAIPDGLIETWVSGVNYSPNDLVWLNGTIYRANDDTFGANPASSFWDAIAPPELEGYIKPWSSFPAYVPGDLVTTTGIIWRATAPNAGLSPLVEPSNWEVIAPSPPAGPAELEFHAPTFSGFDTTQDSDLQLTNSGRKAIRVSETSATAGQQVIHDLTIDAPAYSIDLYINPVSVPDDLLLRIGAPGAVFLNYEVDTATPAVSVTGGSNMGELDSEVRTDGAGFIHYRLMMHVGNAFIDIARQNMTLTLTATDSDTGDYDFHYGFDVTPLVRNPELLTWRNDRQYNTDEFVIYLGKIYRSLGFQSGNFPNVAASPHWLSVTDQPDWNAIAGGGDEILNKPDVVSQAEAEAGTATTERIWTAERVFQAIAANAVVPGVLEWNATDTYNPGQIVWRNQFLAVALTTNTGSDPQVVTIPPDWEFYGIQATWQTGLSNSVANRPVLVDQAEAEAGTATIERIWTSQRVRQNVEARPFGGPAFPTTPALGLNWYRSDLDARFTWDGAAWLGELETVEFNENGGLVGGERFKIGNSRVNTNSGLNRPYDIQLIAYSASWDNNITAARTINVEANNVILETFDVIGNSATATGSLTSTVTAGGALQLQSGNGGTNPSDIIVTIQFRRLP